MEFLPNTNADCCTPTGKYELCGCANGVPYIQLTVVGGGIVQTAWLDTETGDTYTTKPANFVTGPCSAAAAADVVKFSASAPSQIAPFASPKDGYTTVVTDDGLSTGDVTAIYLYEAETATWVKIPVVPAGGTEGQILTAHTDGTRTWEDPAVQAIMDDQVLTGDTTTNTTITMTPTTVADQSGGDQVNYTVKAEVKIDGATIVENATTKVLSAANQKPNALTTAQPTPTATGNTTNLNSIFTDANGVTWFVDYDGDAIQMSSPVFKELNRFYVDPNGNNSNNGANEAPFLTVQAAVAALAQGDIAIVNEGVYTGAVTLNVQNTAISGADGSMNSMTQIASLDVTTASGTSNKVSDLTVLGALTHSGGAPLYLHSVTVEGNVTLTSTAYEEINDCRIQTGTITKTTTGTLYIKDSLIGNATFNTANSVISLDNVSIDVGDVLTIGAGVIYSLNDVRGTVAIDPAAIPLATALQGAGATAAVAKAAETATFNDVRLTNVPTITTAVKALVRDTDGTVSEQEFPSGIPTGGTDGQVLTVQADGSYAWEALPGAAVTGVNVYFNDVDPSTATIFDDENPPVTDDATLKNDSNNTYYGTDGSVWTWNGSGYVTKTYSFPTHTLDRFVATANQTVFTLTKLPVGTVQMFRFGHRKDPIAITVVGKVVTWNPAVAWEGATYGALVAGDVIVFDYEAL